MRYKQILFGLILFAILGVFLQITSKFSFLLYRAASTISIFPETILRIKSVIREVYLRSSGNFWHNFFITPYLGPFIFAALLTGIGLTMRAVVRQITPEKELYLIYLLPVLSLLLAQYDFNYLLQGTVAFLICLLCLNGWIRINNFRFRLFTALLITPLLFWIGGPIAGLFTVCAFIKELFGQFKQGVIFLVIPIEFTLIATQLRMGDSHHPIIISRSYRMPIIIRSYKLRMSYIFLGQFAAFADLRIYMA